MRNFSQRIVFHFPAVLSEFYLRDWNRYSLELTKAMLPLLPSAQPVILETGRSGGSGLGVWKEFQEILPSSNFSYFDFPKYHSPLLRANGSLSEFLKKIFERHLIRLNPEKLISFEPLGSPYTSRSFPLLSKKIPSTALLLDPIPLCFSDAPPSRKEENVKWARSLDLLVVGSELDRNDAINILDISSDAVVAIPGGTLSSCGTDRGYLSPSLERQNQTLFREIILTAAGGSWTPKFCDLIVALGALPPQIRRKTMLVIICDAVQENRREIDRVIERSGLTEKDIYLTGPISEADWISLYEKAKLFILPDGIRFSQSLFDALSKGLPVLVPENSGFYEILGNRDALFDASSPGLIADALVRILTNEQLRRSIVESYSRNLSDLSWEKSARRLMKLWEEKSEKNNRDFSGCRTNRNFEEDKKKLACVVPSKIIGEEAKADTLNTLCEGLKRSYDLEYCYIDGKDNENGTDISRISASYNLSPDTRTLYFVGKDLSVESLLEMLIQRPGIVVLLDFFLGSTLSTDSVNGWSALAQEALLSHGTMASWEAMDQSYRQEFLKRYPLNGRILNEAQGVLCCDPGMLRLIQSFYPDGIGAAIGYFPRPVNGFPRTSRSERAGPVGAILLIGVPDTDQHWDHLTRILRRVDETGTDHRWTITILLHPEEIPLFLKKLDGASPGSLPFCVQPIEDKEQRTHCLNSSSLGVVLKNYSSGDEWEAFLEAMGSGLPLLAPSEFLCGIVPEAAVISIPPGTSNDLFDERLHRALTDLLIRKSCVEEALRWIEGRHSLEASAHEVAEFIEQCRKNWAGLSDEALSTPLSTYLGEIPRRKRREEGEKLSLLAANSEPLLRPERLYIDLTRFLKSKRKGEMTGIQRVIQNLCSFLPAISSTPVYTFRIGQDIGHSFFLNSSPTDPTMEHIWETPYALSIRPGDLILFPDTILDTKIYEEFLEYCQSRGAFSSAIVYDLLPISLPHCFTSSHADNFRRWLEITLAKSDRIFCDSKATMDELVAFLHEEKIPRRSPLKIGFFTLGADSFLPDREAPALETDIPENVITFFSKNADPVFLMVGTVEPRKNHGYVLDVFENLWKNGVESRLCIVGRVGWKVSGLVKKLRHHEECGKRLLFVDDASDLVLDYCYRMSEALIMASIGEGFGLPIIEGARRGLPVIVNDLPVFREICGDHALYFSCKISGSLETLVFDWNKLQREGRIPDPSNLHRVSWEESARELNELIHASGEGLLEYP